MPRDLTALFCPKSIAVIGASRSPEKVGAIVFKNIIESKFPGHVYPVNPNADNIAGHPCFKDVNSLPEVPDLAVIALPAAQVIDTLNQIGGKGIKNVIVLAAGFKEAGAEGAKLEAQLAETAQKYNLNLLGPNCLGFASNDCPVNVTFGQPVNLPGNLRFILQSGAIAAALFDWCKTTGLGFAEFVTLGNKTVLSENDILEYFQNTSVSPSNMESKPSVHPIGLYLESVSEGAKFLQLVSQLSKTDPVFILKPGKSSAAAKAMQSHTGAIAGEDAVLEAVLKEAGAIRCQTLEDFFDFARAFAWERAPIGPKVAIISNAGGPAVISADAVIKEGLELAEFDDQVKGQLTQILPRSASILNPVDVLGDALAERIGRAAEAILQTNEADALLVILTPQVMTQVSQTAELIGALSKKYQKPIFCSFIGGQLISEGETVLNKYQIPSFRFPERAIAAIGAMWKFRQHQLEKTEVSQTPMPTVELDTAKIKEIISLAGSQKTLDNLAANDLLKSAGITTPFTQAATDLEQAKSFAKANGWPVVLKLSSPGLLHKKDLGGVITDIGNEVQLETALDKLERKITQLSPEIHEQVKVQIQKDVMGGVEVIVGVKDDPTFGKVLLFGAGGSLAELIADRNLHLLPLDLAQIKTLVEKSKIFTLLKGHDGEPPLALDKLYELVNRLAKLAETAEGVEEIEINPVIVTLNDAWAIDGKVVLSAGQHPPVSTPKFQTAATLNHTNLATTFHYFEFETEKPFTFQPGQYISVKVAQQRINCYSIAGQTADNRFNLLVNVAPGGPGSKFFQNLKVGDKIAYLGPLGTFTLKLDDGAKQLLFLATGCGLAPLKAMLESALSEHYYQQPIHLYLGVNTPEDIFGLGYFQKMAEIFPNFKYKIIVSEPNASWHGETGFVTDLAAKNFTDASDLAAYLSGNKNMIAGATEVLQSHNCPKERIYTEKY